MNYNALKILHLVGLALTFMGLTGILTLRLAGQGKLPQRLLFHISYGVGLLFIIVTGFTMAAQLGIVQKPPGWLNAKAVIWLLASASMILATRFSKYATAVYLFFIALVATAAWLALEKPF